ncbi:MAG TPA: peptidoglycan DD-metalloendopeptidase family protein [Rubrobacteraceae bacterium]|nr:peptidoglycan DD-metalloendopeptidase family protein [Rubrobacteraceae bacterium]
MGLAAIGLLALAASGAAAATSDGLEAAVTNAMLQEGDSARGLSVSEKQERTQTNVERTSEDNKWAFGTAVIEAPKKEGYYPEGWLFVAQKSGGTWKVGLEGTPEFSTLAEDAPDSVVDDGEKEMFSRSGGLELQSTSTGLQLPWKRGVRWKMSGGPHGWSTGYDRPYSALDLTGGSGKVRAAGRGRVYTMCSTNRGWIRVYHPNGYSTDYYHLRKNIKPRDGRRIRAGAFLGYTGTDVSCGGSASGRHVHFALLRGDRHVALDNKTIGGWTFQQGAAYKGYAKHKTIKRFPPNGLLRNYG